MPLWANRVQETSASTGTGNIVVNGPAVNYRTFFSSVGIGAEFEYEIENVDVPGEWEVGVGVMVGVGILQRNTVYDSSAGVGLVNFSAGTKKVYITLAAQSIKPDASYTHTQALSAATWTIVHNLGKMPAVSVVDSANTKVYGEVVYIDTNTLQVLFTAAFSGYAYLN